MGRDSIVDRAARRALRTSLPHINERGDYFTTYHQRPKHDLRITPVADPLAIDEPMAIVMQGPPWPYDDFTYQTLSMYRRVLPQCQIFLSTWNDVDPEFLARVEALGVQLVLSDKPNPPGLFNINMQLVSAGAGVRAAAAAGAQWVLKTRTDQRLGNPNAMPMLVGVAKAFPAAEGFDQRHRIVCVGQGSLRYATYHVTDQTNFGHVDDMLKFWSAPLREADGRPAHFPEGSIAVLFDQVPVRDLCRHVSPECYLGSQFAQRVGRTLDWTLADSWGAFRDHYCVVDYAATDFFWVKVQRETLKEYVLTYARDFNRREFNFGDWTMLYSGVLDPEIATSYEHFLDTPFVPPKF